jgi:hypothetical protein
MLLRQAMIYRELPPALVNASVDVLMKKLRARE